MERYGSMDEFNEALEERRVLDERENRRQSRRGGATGTSTPGSSGVRTPDAGGGRRFMFMSEEAGSRPNSRAGFRRPGEPDDMATSSGAGGARVAELRRSESNTPRMGHTSLPGSGAAKVATPIPNVFTPTSLTSKDSGFPFAPDTASDPTGSKPPMSTEALNKMQAKVLRAKLMDDPQAQDLEDEYERERARSERAGGDQGRAGMWSGSGEGMQGQMGREAENGGLRTEVQVLPTLDGRGRLYDVGTGQQDEQPTRGNKRKKPEKVGSNLDSAHQC